MKLQSIEPETAESPAGPASIAIGGRWLLLARIGWVVAALGLVGLFVAAVPARYEQIATLSNLPEGIDSASLRAGLERSGLSVDFYAAWRLGMEVVFAVVCVALGAVIFWRRSDRRMALFVSLLLVLLGTTFWNTISALSLYHPAWERIGLGLAGLRAVSLFLLFYIFPDGRFVPRWTRWLALVMVVGVVSDIVHPESPLRMDDMPVPHFILFMLFWLLTGVFAQVYRYWRVSGPVERQQAKWVTFGFTAAITGLLGVLLFGEVLFPGPPGTPAELFGSTLVTLFMLLIPVSIGTAILRYRLFDMDVLINRVLVYGALSAIVAGLYILVVGGLGTLLQARGNLLISLLGAGFVAVLFAPLRDRLQRGVNRLMYGERDDPYAVISRLGERLEGTLAPEAALETIAQTMFQDDDSVFAAMRAGARGYLLKDVSGEEVLGAIRAVTGGGAIFSPGVARRLIEFFSAPKPAAPPRAFPELTGREEEILGFIARGHSNQEIAESLYLSLKTVQNHVSIIFTKLQVADRAQAIIRAREAGMGNPDT